MKILTDCFGRHVRITAERLTHILERPELRGMSLEIEVVLRQPQFARLSRSDAGVRLFYDFYPETMVGDNYYASWLNTTRLTRLWLLHI